MTSLLLLLLGCESQSGIKLLPPLDEDTSSDDTSHNASHHGSGNTGKDPPSDFPKVLSCNVAKMAVPGGDSISWNLFSPTVLQDGAYGTRGQLATLPDQDITQRNQNITDNAPDIFIADADISELADVLDCKFDMTFFFGIYNSRFSTDRSAYMWSTLGYHKGEVPDTQAVIDGSSKFPVANIYVGLDQYQVGNLQTDIHLESSLAAANEPAEDKNSNTIDYSQFVPKGSTLTINNLPPYYSGQPEYTLDLSKILMMYEANDVLWSTLSPLCPPVTDEWKWCEIYLKGS